MREEKKITTLPFTISYGRNVSRQETKLVHVMRATLGTKNYGFRRVPKGRGFSYTGYFLPSGHVRAILVQL